MTAPDASPDDAYARVWRSVAEVNGWMTHDQGRWLFRAAGTCPRGGRIVEIGSFQGRSTIVLAHGAPADAEVIAIDPHAGNDRGPQEIDGFVEQASEDHRLFLTNLVAAGVADRVRHVRRPSHEAHDAVSDPIDVLYVDGAHRFALARRDLVDWGRRVRPGGVLLIHDAFSSVGVTAAMVTSLATSRRWRYVGRTRSLARFDADLTSDGRSRVVNAARVLAQLPWFARNVALKVALTLGGGRLWRWAGREVPSWPY
jgi:predicted O-methyltransferase YrrM